MSKAKGGSPRKFSEKIALLNRKEAEANAEFAKIIKEVEETTRAPTHPTHHHHRQQQQPQRLQPVLYPSRASSSSRWVDGGFCAYGGPNSITTIDELNHQAQTPRASGSLGDHQFMTHYHLSDIQQQQQQQHNDFSMQMRHQHQHPQQHQHHQHLLHPQQQQQPVATITLSPSASPVTTPTTPTSTILDSQQISVETPVGVPNINIFPIDDDDYQQQVPNSIILNNRSSSDNNLNSLNNNNNTDDISCSAASYRNDCSNPISPARSLPDIANLRVSGNSPVLTPAYSDQRITTDYDCNSVAAAALGGSSNNVVTPTTTTTTNNNNHSNSVHNNSNYCSLANGNCNRNHVHQHHQPHQVHLQQPQAWQVADGQFTNQQHNSQPQLQNIQTHQDYCQPFQEGGTIVRANSVLCGWQETNSTTSTGAGSCGAGASNNHHQMMIRSSSFNNIDNIDFQSDNARNTYPRQQQTQTFASEQNPTQYQFYE